MIDIKLNIGEKIAGLETMALNQEKNLASFQNYRTDV